MTKNFPRDMLALATNPAAKLILFSDNQPKLDGCLNCGGLGFFNVFVATDGPFQEPGFPYNGTAEDHKISHWHDGKWWVGKSYNFNCPDCGGHGKRSFIQVPNREKVGVK